jgi:hypothetical protein
MASLFEAIVLQNLSVLTRGHTQNNMAVVKAEVDFIRSSFRSGDRKPEIIVHEHCGESGAIGAAVEAGRLYRNGRRTSFIGLDAVRSISYRTTRNEDTRCYFGKNNCLRTFIDVTTGDAPKNNNLVSIGKVVKTKVPLKANEQRLIIATCEKGTVEEMDDMKEIKAEIDAAKKNYPNFVDLAAHGAFRSRKTELVADPIPIAGVDAIRQGPYRTDEEPAQFAHRHSASIERVCVRASVQWVL